MPVLVKLFSHKIFENRRCPDLVPRLHHIFSGFILAALELSEAADVMYPLFCQLCSTPFLSRMSVNCTIVPHRTLLRGWAATHKRPVRMREKLSKAKPRDIKGVVCRGLPWVLFWPEILLSPIMRSRYKRIVMQSSSESSAEHALVDALRIVFLRHQGRSWAQVKAETGISKGTAQRAMAGLPRTPIATASPSP